MKTDSYLKYILSDNASLRKYYNEHSAVSLKDIKRSVLLNARKQQYAVPDHYYRLGLENAFAGINCLSEVFTVGLPHLASDYLEFNDKCVCVKAEKFNEWQLLLPQIPPLLLVVAYIWRYGEAVDGSVVDYAHQYLKPSVMYSALPQVFIPEMKKLKEENNGMSDLHIHLNGAMETDLVWHDFLRYPTDVYHLIRDAFKNESVKEQIEQMTDVNQPIDFYNLFCIAGNLREWLYCRTVHGRNIFESLTCDNSFSSLLREIGCLNNCYPEHPFKAEFGSDVAPLLLEASLYVSVFNYLSKQRENDAVAGVFHYYLLILGLCNKLLVQQTDSFGFEQFQKYTSNKLRDLSEKTYQQRFLQLAGNRLDNILHIEGRFSPKDSCDEDNKLITRINDGFHLLNKIQSNNGLRQTRLSLVAHFIKKRDNGDGSCRFQRLRNELNKKTEALIQFLNEQSSLAQLVTGVDAAASEFDTPPEVFAPCFRRLRKSGVKHFTYHAGEDFFHILSGLRAIYESIIFLGLKAGDRIGHATAAGVDVTVWKNNIGKSIWIRREDYLSDLIFAYYLISSTKDEKLRHLLPSIALKIEEHSSKIYDKNYSAYEMTEAWLFRATDPHDIDNHSTTAKEEIFHCYHSKHSRKKGAEIISVDVCEVFGAEEIVRLQKLLLREMHQKQIVIETLPTSNVIIGHHHGFETYHLYNWYKWSKEGEKVPAIVVGTDDAGVFATNIYNEYCHIYCMMVFEKGLSPNEAIDYIERLVHNAKVYAFD